MRIISVTSTEPFNAKGDGKSDHNNEISFQVQEKAEFIPLQFGRQKYPNSILQITR